VCRVCVVVLAEVFGGGEASLLSSLQVIMRARCTSI
jgi:hypothetical protein